MTTAANPWLALAITVTLTVTLVLAIIAARGYWKAPFGSMVKPLPVVFGAFIALNAPVAVNHPISEAYFAVCSAVAVTAALVMGVRTLQLLTEHRQL